MPLPVPTRPWDSVSMDFITNLPNVDGYDAILTVVCSLTKMAHFIPCNSTVNSRHLAKLFLDNVYRLHGLPRFLIGDRDTRYTSHFFKNLMLELKTTLCLSTAYHPQTMETRKGAIEQLSKYYVPLFTPIIMIGCQAYPQQNLLTIIMSIAAQVIHLLLPTTDLTSRTQEPQADFRMKLGIQFSSA